MNFIKKYLLMTIVSMLTFSVTALCAEKIEKPIQINGDVVEYFQNEQKAVGIGHVVINYEGDSLSADKITVYMDKKTAHAEGNVVLTLQGAVYKGPSGEYDFAGKKGNISQLTAVIPGAITPYYAKAKKVERVSENHYRTTDGYITTCCSDNPFYKLQAQRVDVYPDDRVEIRNALLVVKGMPILFIPFYVQHFYEIHHFPVQIIPGKTDEYGAFILTKWRYSLFDSPAFKSRGNILLDYREKRGFGYGVENFYKGPAIGRGAIKYYSTRDRQSPIADDPERSRLQLRHQMKLTPTTVLTLEANKLSDRDMIKDFFYSEEYERNVQPDNYVSIITATPDYSLSFLERRRLDDFFTVVERNPEIQFDTYNKQFADTPFYIREEVRASQLQKRVADDESEYDTVRVDNNYTVLYAGHFRNLAITPRVGTRQTFYTRDTYDESSVWRGTFDPGLDISTHFFKVYDTTVHAWGLDYNQIRHIFTPTISYNFRPNPTVGRDHLLQFDQIDTLDKQHYIRFNFENRLQTKEHSGRNHDGALGIREIARFAPFFDMDYTTDRLENIGYEVELRPTTWLGVISNGTYSSRLRAFETVNTDFYTSFKNVRLSLGQRYLRRDSSLLVASTSIDVNDQWSVSVYRSHEFKEANDAPDDTGITITRRFECVAVDVILNSGRESAIYFVLHIKGFPDTPLNLLQKTYRREKLTTQSTQRLSLTSV